jgi:hypothetical protein
MAAATEITAADKLKCVERELKRRYEAYPRLVDSGKRTQQWANRELELLEEIAADYTAMVRALGEKDLLL